MKTPSLGRKVLGTLVAAALAATGLLTVTTVAADAHQGSIRVTSAVCVDADTVQVGYRWSWAGVPRSSAGTAVVRRTGTTSFEGGWSGRGGAPLTTVDSSSGAVSWTVRLRRSQFAGGDGPWEYVYAPWADGYPRSRFNDTRVEGLDWRRCAGTAPADASAAVTTVRPTCDAAERLVLGSVVHATWGTPTRTTGPGPYAVTATAVAGHLFPDGARTRTFTGSLAARLSGRACAGPAPAGERQTRAVADRPDCTARTVTSWTEERSREAVWSDAESRYVPGAWTPWTQVRGSVRTAPATAQQCPPPAGPITIRGAVRKLDKCGRHDFFRARAVVGGTYRVAGRPVATGVWVKARKRTVRITFAATGPGYRVAGRRTFRLRFPHTRACGRAPSSSPDTGARPAARTLPHRLVVPRTGTDARVVTVPVRRDRLAVGHELTHTVYTWSQGDPPCDPLGTTVYAGHAWRHGPGVADRWGTLRPGDRLSVGGCSFRVTKVASWPARRSVRGLFRVDGPPRVVLISCEPGDYGRRTMVFARRLG